MQDLSLGRLLYSEVGQMRRKQKRGLGRTASEEGGTAGDGGVWKSKKENVSRKREGSVELMWSNEMTTKNESLLKLRASYLVARLNRCKREGQERIWTPWVGTAHSQSNER